MTFSPSLQSKHVFSGMPELPVPADSQQPSASAAPAELIISKEQMTLRGKIVIAVASCIALIALTLLSACVVAALGSFPLLLSFLNMVTAGACLSLPLLVCLSMTMLAVSCWAIHNVLTQPFSVHLVSSVW